MEAARLAVNGNWENVLNKPLRQALESALPDFLRAQRWFGGKARRLGSVEIEDAIHIPHESRLASLAMLRVNYAQGKPDAYALPLAFASGREAEEAQSACPKEIVAGLKAGGVEGALITPLRDRNFCLALLEAIGGGKSFKSDSGGEIRGVPTRAFARLAGRDASLLVPSLMRAEQSNSSILYGGRLVLKLFRRLEEGVNPDLEVGAFLTESGFAHIPALGGALEYRRKKGEPITLGILQEFVRNEGDAWSFALDALSHFYDRVTAHGDEILPEVYDEMGLWETAGHAPSSEAQGLIGNYLDAAGLLGRRTAELHLALASDPANPAFAPEPFTRDYQRTLVASMRSRAAQTFQLLEQRLETLPEAVREESKRVRALEPRVLDRFRSIQDLEVRALRTRVHGDYHLGQVLYTGGDFVIIDFEGEPALPISERRTKRSPLADVAGMLRSFHYAAYGALMSQTAGGVEKLEDFSALEPWAGRWYGTVAAAFLRAYLDAADQAPFLPKGRDGRMAFLEAYQLEKAVYEMAYELNNRPDWLRIPVQGILRMMGDAK